MTDDLTARNAYLAVPLRDRVKARRVERETQRIKEALPDHLPPLVLAHGMPDGTSWVEAACVAADIDGRDG